MKSPKETEKWGARVRDMGFNASNTEVHISEKSSLFFFAYKNEIK